MDEQPSGLYFYISESYGDSYRYDYLYGDGNEFKLYSIELCSGDSESTTFSSTECESWFYMQWSVFYDSSECYWRYCTIDICMEYRLRKLS